MKQSGAWRAGIGMYSGRPDPVWIVSTEAVREFEMIWERLEPSSKRAPMQPPPLGYRGCFVKADDVCWECYRGMVKLVRPGSPDQFRLDPDRQLEWWVVRSAPPKALPDNLVEVLGLGPVGRT